MQRRQLQDAYSTSLPLPGWQGFNWELHTSGTVVLSEAEAASVVTDREATAKGAAARARRGSAALGTRRALDSILGGVVE